MYRFMQSAAAAASQGGAAWMGELERRFGKARLNVCQQIETIRTLFGKAIIYLVLSHSCCVCIRVNSHRMSIYSF